MAADRPPVFEMDRLLSYDDESLLAEVRRVLAEVPPGPVSRAEFGRRSKVTPGTLIRRFGSWREVLTRVGSEERYSGRLVTPQMRVQTARAMSTDDVIQELQRVAATLGRSKISKDDVRIHSQLGDRIFISRFGSWKAAVAAAGLELSRKGQRWTDDDYFENLLEVWTHHSRPPTYAEMNRPPSRITNGAYAAKFGSWGLAKRAFVDRMNDDSVSTVTPELAPPVWQAKGPVVRGEDQRSIRIGLRYQVLRRDRFRCVACGRSPATDLGCVLHVDHVIAFSRGGKTVLANLRTLCAECNVGKGPGDE